MIKYGLISETDAHCLEKTLELIMSAVKMREPIYTTQVGVFDGQTDRGIHEYITRCGLTNYHTAIDSQKDKPILKPFPECNLIIGDSNEVYNQLEDNSQHLIFIDGCHCFAHVVSDFFCYADKVKDGGYIAFHDTGEHIKPFKDFQHGDKLNPRAYISVRDALDAIGLLDYQTSERWLGFELIYDEADPNDEAGGICVFKKLY